MKTVNRL